MSRESFVSSSLSEEEEEEETGRSENEAEQRVIYLLLRWSSRWRTTKELVTCSSKGKHAGKRDA